MREDTDVTVVTGTSTEIKAKLAKLREQRAKVTDFQGGRPSQPRLAKLGDSPGTQGLAPQALIS